MAAFTDPIAHAMPTDGGPLNGITIDSAYRLEREIGSGGMATVYLATDVKHQRRVAVKVLHSEISIALGAERFLSEIRVMATLQHPHILGLIDSGVVPEDGTELQGRPYYVMPYVEGESLRARLQRERQLPVADALRIAREVAGALDYAHRAGFVHRDIKPENILLHDGTALVADFGIALALHAAGGSRLTQTGISLGTPEYMSPEQAMGERELSPRADIYALGAVLYEMLVGEPPFTGPTGQAIVARLMSEDPRPITVQRRSVPAEVEAAVFTALERLPADRFATAAAFAEALAEDGPRTERRSGPTRSWVRSRGERLTRTVAIGAIAVAVVASIVAVWGWTRPRGADIQFPPLRATLLPPDGESFRGGVALSPDGSHLASVVRPTSTPARLWLRTLATGLSVAIPGTEGAEAPFWSPDGRRIAFFARSRLQVVDAAGGPVTTIVETPAGRGGTWGADGTILFGADSAGLIYRTSVDGSDPVPVTTRGSEGSHSRPSFLPDGRHFVFSGFGNTGIFLGDLQTRTHTVLRHEGGSASWAPSGYVIYAPEGRHSTAEGGRLVAQRLDVGAGALVGSTILVADDISRAPGAASYSVSSNGLLVFQPSILPSPRFWMDRHGNVVDSVPADNSSSFRLSRDGVRLAQGSFGGLWVRDLRRRVAMRMPGDSLPVNGPVWSPGGTLVAHATRNISGGASVIRIVPADGSGTKERTVTGPAGMARVEDWSPDGRSLLVAAPGTRPDDPTTLWLTDAATGVTRRWLSFAGRVSGARISPDGRMVAYQSDETGSPEIYVRPFPKAGAPVRLSLSGGMAPTWRGDGRELFYLAPDGDLMAVSIDTRRTVEVSTPSVVIARLVRDPSARSTRYEPSPDGQRFLVADLRQVRPPLTLVAPWSGSLNLPSR